MQSTRETNFHEFPIECILKYESEEQGKLTEMIELEDEEEYCKAISKAKEIRGRLYKKIDEKEMSYSIKRTGSPYYIKMYLENGEPKTVELELRYSSDVIQELRTMKCYGGKLYQEVYPDNPLSRCFRARDFQKDLQDSSERSRKNPKYVGQSESRF